MNRLSLYWVVLLAVIISFNANSEGKIRAKKTGKISKLSPAQLAKALPKEKAPPPEEEDPDPPPPDEDAPPPEEPPSEDETPPLEANDSPDDEGIEYAKELTDEELAQQQKEAEEKAKEEEQKQRRSRLALPKNEPMPLIRRQRETIEYSNQLPPKRIRHPLAAKGLMRITKDKVYIYKVKSSDQTKASSFKAGMFNLKNLENKNTGVAFSDFYESNNIGLLYDYEWQLFRKFGKAGIKIGSGLAMAQGTGQFKNANNLTGAFTPKEKLTFFVIPNSIGAIVRLQFWDKQMFVPYGEGGGVLFGFAETRDDGKTPKFGGALGAYFAAGVAFSLKFLDDLNMLELDREYSINNVFFTAEYRYYKGFGNFDFTGDLINGGVTVEF